jgi:hypothetical protein
VLAFACRRTHSEVPRSVGLFLHRKGTELEECSRFETGQAREFVEARRHPRYKLEVDVRVYPRNAAVRGHSVDISESGISAMLRVEVPVGEVVRLEFSLPLGPVEVHALVRQRNAFRYGLQFVEEGPGQGVVARTCRELAIEETLRNDSVV